MTYFSPFEDNLLLKVKNYGITFQIEKLHLGLMISSLMEAINYIDMIPLN